MATIKRLEYSEALGELQMGNILDIHPYPEHTSFRLLNIVEEPAGQIFIDEMAELTIGRINPLKHHEMEVMFASYVVGKSLPKTYAVLRAYYKRKEFLESEN